MLKEKQIDNGLSTLSQGLTRYSAQLSQTDTLRRNNRYYYIFNDRLLLNTLYIEHGLIQTLIDQPVDDAFRGGLEIKSKQLDDEDIKELNQYLEVNEIYRKIMQAIKWGRLFGGSGLVIMTSQPSDKEFNINKLNKFSPLDFYPADLWELNLQYYLENPSQEITEENPYMFYGKPLNKSRVLKFKGKEAPSMIRRRFRGWGMSEIERFIRSFNQYLKNQDVIFELLDEAKVDVYKLENFNSSLLSNADQAIQTRIELSNMLKNYLHSLVMDKNDEYDQKQVTFQGLGKMLQEIRMGIASDLKIPITKLFGVSSTGFNSGEDDIENYNAMIDSEIRSKVKGLIIQVLKICIKKIFDIVVDDLNIEWKPLRILNAEQEENVKNAKTNRLLSLMSTGLIDISTAKQIINKDNLVSIDIKINDELFISTPQEEIPNITDEGGIKKL
jgi:phage-related protein (TIGR01555 family)